MVLTGSSTRKHEPGPGINNDKVNGQQETLNYKLQTN